MLSFSKAGNNNSLGGNMYYNKGTISSVKDVTDHEEGQMFGKKDIAIQVDIMVDGLEFPKKVTLSGDFKKDTNNVVIEWGGAFVVQKLFQAAGIKGALGEDMKVPEAILKTLVGKEIAFLTYKNKQGKFSTFRQMFSVDTDRNIIKDMFLKDRARLDKGGWNNNYDSGDALPSSGTTTTQEPWQQTQQKPVANGTSNELDFLK